MKKDGVFNIVDKINRFAAEQGGVFTFADLSNLISGGSQLKNIRAINQLVGAGILTKVQKGIYAAKKFDPEVLATKINPTCYISLDSALAEAGLIGTLPLRRVSAIRLGGRTKNVTVGESEITYYSISKDLFFGFERRLGGVAIALPEKAFLDTLYFYCKGRRFVIDPLKEINITLLNKKRLGDFLKRYKNPKFVTFIKGLINEEPKRKTSR